MAPVAGYIAQVTFQYASGLPRDVTENVFHFAEFGAGAANLAGANQVVQRLADFYAGGNPITADGPLASFLASEIEPLVKVKVYDLGAAEPRPILYQDSFTITPATGQSLPPEVALCLSYFSSVNVKRQRGRIYIGPFGITDVAGGTGYSQPNSGLIATMVEAATRLTVNTGSCAQGSTTLLPDTPATGPVKVIWSVLSGLGTGTKLAPAPELYVIDHGWVDNEWDGQRRRRIAATSRSAWAPA